MNYDLVFQTCINLPIDIKILILIFIFAVITFILKFFMSNEPTLDSKLNSRQTFSALSVTLLIIGSCYFCHIFFENDFLFLLALFIVIVQVLSILFWLYDPFFYILGTIKRRFNKKEELGPVNNFNKFAIIVCAHNEEKVVGNLLDSINKMHYDKMHYDTYVICDNCEDGTEKVVDTHNAIKMIRHDLTKMGKGYAIEWFFKALKHDFGRNKYYDAYVILDADNLVNSEFLSKMNVALNNGEDVIQAYLGCKNPDATWVSRSYSLSYWITNDLFQNVHNPAGLSAQLGGTGMVFRREVFDKIRICGRSLTEDLLFSTEYVLKTNKSCYWEEDAIILDEKPLKLSDSVKQRTRWMQGHVNICFRYFFKLVISSIKNRSYKQLDVAFYLIKPILNFFLFIGYIVIVLAEIFLPAYAITVPIIATWQFFTGLLLAYLILYSIILTSVGKQQYIRWLPLVLIYSLTYYLPIFRGIVKRNEKHWVKTDHVCAMKISENK